jgi:hypothetical protein
MGHNERQHQVQTLLRRLLGNDAVVWPEMAFRPTAEYDVWQVNVGYVSTQRYDATPDDEYFAGPPDLVVEILSPSDTMYEINDKMSICLDNGCKSFWVIDEKRKRVSVTEGNVTWHYGIADSITCSLFSGQIPVREIFE